MRATMLGLLLCGFIASLSNPCRSQATQHNTAKGKPDASETSIRKVVIQGDFKEAKDCEGGFIVDDNLHSIDLGGVTILNASTAEIEYRASEKYRPARVTFNCATSLTVPFKIFLGLRSIEACFNADDLNKNICGKECNQLKAGDIKADLVPWEPAATYKALVEIADGEICVEIEAPLDYVPHALKVTIGDRSIRADAR